LDASRLKSIPLFEDVPEDELGQIAGFAQEVTVEQGRELVREGDFSYEFMAIEEGEAEVTADGRHVAERGPGDVVGELSLITARPRMADLIADGDVRTIWITRRAFEGMVHDRPDVAIGVMRVLATRLAEHGPERASQHLGG